MPTFLRMMEILACSMAEYLPYLLLVIYPFRNHVRLKSFLAGLLTLLMTPAVLYYDISCALLGTVPVALPFPLLRSAALLLLAVLVIHVHPGKNLLNTFSVINLSILISALADRFAADYTAKHLLVTLLLQAVLLAPYTFNLVYVLSPTLNESKALVWKLLFLAPAAGTVIGCMMLLNGSSTLITAMLAALVLAAVVSALTVIFTKTEVITLFRKKDRTSVPAAATPVVTAEPQRDTVQDYLSNMQKRMLDAELSCKELLLQVMTMEDDLNSNDLVQLREKLTAMRNQLAPQVASSGNVRIDPVLTYYTRQSLLSNIKIAMNVSLPDMCSVSDEDLTVLLGCLLDLAIDACREQASGTRRIATASHLDDDLLQVGIKHTYAYPVDKDCELLEICRSIVSRYDGKVTVIDMNGISQTVVTLHI